MLNTFRKLAQSNVDHYNNHPKQHAVITAGFAALGLGAIVFGNRHLEKMDTIYRSGQFA